MDIKGEYMQTKNTENIVNKTKLKMSQILEQRGSLRFFRTPMRKDQKKTMSYYI
jgi:capsule polysaccharide export protein KpsE/RkpR